MVVMMIQAAGIALFCLGGLFEKGTPQQEAVLLWNPMAHLVLGWQRSIFPEVIPQPLYENFYLGFFVIFKREFEKKSKIHIMRSFVPNSYPQRMEKYYKEDSKLWFSMKKISLLTK